MDLRQGFQLDGVLVRPNYNLIIGPRGEVRLEPRVMEVLVHLAERPGEVVTREALMNATWGAVIVTDESLTRCISELRRALGDSASAPRFISTIPKRGYRLIAGVEPWVDPNTLLGTSASGGKRWLPRVAVGVGAGVALAGLLLSLVIVGVDRSTPGRSSNTVVDSIAVLPFTDLSTDAEHAYFSEGVTVEILNALANVRGLKVTAPQSVFNFENRSGSASEIGSQLGVAALLEGAVRRSDDRVRISVRLIDAGSGFQIWSQAYEHRLGDIFAIQQDIARSIVDELNVEQIGRPITELFRGQTTDLAAYDLYLLARYRWARRSGEGLEQALGYLQAALARDPEYALAHAGIADVYAVMSWYTDAPAVETFNKAKRHALRALELEPELAAAHATLGVIAHEHEWRWQEAERYLQQALSLKPSYATAHQWYCNLLSSLQRFEESIEACRRAVELDPLSSVIRMNYAGSLTKAGRLDDGLEQFDRAISLDPEFALVYNQKAVALLAAGRFEQAAKSLVTWGRLIGLGNADRLRGVIVAATEPERREAARDVLAALDARTGAPGRLFALVPLYWRSGDTEACIRAIERAYQRREPELSYLPVFAWFQEMREHARVERVLRRMGWEPHLRYTPGDSAQATRLVAAAQAAVGRG